MEPITIRLAKVMAPTVSGWASNGKEVMVETT